MAAFREVALCLFQELAYEEHNAGGAISVRAHIPTSSMGCGTRYPHGEMTRKMLIPPSVHQPQHVTITRKG